jgi:hypothetical protein
VKRATLNTLNALIIWQLVISSEHFMRKFSFALITKEPTFAKQRANTNQPNQPADKKTSAKHASRHLGLMAVNQFDVFISRARLARYLSTRLCVCVRDSVELA